MTAVGRRSALSALGMGVTLLAASAFTGGTTGALWKKDAAIPGMAITSGSLSATTSNRSLYAARGTSGGALLSVPSGKLELSSRWALWLTDLDLSTEGDNLDALLTLSLDAQDFEPSDSGFEAALVLLERAGRPASIPGGSVGYGDGMVRPAAAGLTRIGTIPLMLHGDRTVASPYVADPGYRGPHTMQVDPSGALIPPHGDVPLTYAVCFDPIVFTQWTSSTGGSVLARSSASANDIFSVTADYRQKDRT